MCLVSESLFAFHGILGALQQVGRFGLPTILAATVLVTAPEARRSDARLCRVAQGAGGSGLPVFRQANAGHQFFVPFSFEPLFLIFGV